MDGSGSYDLDGDPLKYRWDFNNDGTWDTSYSTNPLTIFTRLDDYSSTVILEVFDGTSTDTDSTTVTVNNKEPTVTTGSDLSVGEGETIYFSGIFTDPGLLDTHTIEWDFGDGNTDSGTLTPTHAYGDNGIYTVNLTVTDDDGGVGYDTLTVTVSNKAPSVSATMISSAQEGDTVNFGGSFTDPGFLDTHTIKWNFGDGNTDSGTLTPSHVYGDNGIYTVSLTVTDDDGGVGADSFSISVSNVAPTVSAGSDQTVDEGDTVNFGGSFTDPGFLDTHSIDWDLGDGNDAQNTLTPSHVYVEDGAYSVTLKVTDDDGGSGSDQMDVKVINVAPSVNAGLNKIVFEGDTVDFSGSFSDPGTLDTHTIEWDFGDGNTASGTLSPSHAYGDNGIYTVTLTVTDDDGAVGSDTLTVSVYNVAPAVDAGADQNTYEGTSVNFGGSYSDPGWLDTHTIHWDFGDGNTETGTLTPSHVYKDNGVYTATLTVTDDDGGVGSDTLMVTVANVAPTVSIDNIVQPNPDFILALDILEFYGSFTDPGILDTHTIEWNFGDGSPVVTGTLTPTHAYGEPGEYTVMLKVTDNDLDSGSDFITLQVSNPAQATEMLVEDVEDMELPGGLESSLSSKLNNAIVSMDKGRDNAAVNKLEAFKNQVEAQRGKKLTNEQADELLRKIQWVIDYLNS
jgi:PKD repeat protein